MLGALIAGGLSTLGGWLTNRANAREAQKNRDFQERMASSQAQRSVADYAAAGLNPALAYERSAAAPGGAQANLGNPLEGGVSSAMQARQANAQIDLIKAQTAKAKAEAESADVDAAIKSGRAPQQVGMPNYIATEMRRRAFEWNRMDFDERTRWGLEAEASRAGTRLAGSQSKLADVNARLAGADVNKRQFFSDLFGSARDFQGFVRENAFGRAGEAAEAAGAWGSAAMSSAKAAYNRAVRGGALDPAARKRLRRALGLP